MHPAKKRRLMVAGGAALSTIVIATAKPLATGSTVSTTPTVVEMLEWDLPQKMDNEPGAVIVDLAGDANRLWFVTRVESPRIYRLDLRGGKKVNRAQWFSWDLEPDIANGIRKIKTSGDKRSVFVHTPLALQRVDTLSCTTFSDLTVTCPRTTWIHDATTPPDPHGSSNPLSGSDVAIDEYNNVFFALAGNTPDASFIQRLNPDPNVKYNNVTRWYVGHNAGFCSTSADSAPCLSGIAIDRRNRYLVYYSEPGTSVFNPATGLTFPDMGAIAELDTRTGAIRRWQMSDLAKATGDPTIHEPRQLQFDDDGRLWTVTGSGHLVSLDPGKSRMSKHVMPTQDALKDPFGVSPDSGLIGYTDANLSDSRVGMLMPAKQFVPVYPTPGSAPPSYFTITGNTVQTARGSGYAMPKRQQLTGQIVRKDDGTFSEAFTTIQGNMPLGITPDVSASHGTFLFAIGDPADGLLNRVARIRLPRKEMRARIERDDDDTDDDGKRADVDDDVDDDGITNAFDTDNDNDGIPDAMDDDDDNDGIEDSFDTKDHKETKQTSQQDIAPGTYAEDPFTLNSNTLLAVASAVSSDPLAQVRVEVVDAAGNVVAASLPAAGAAVVTFVPPAAGGTYSLRVKNQGVTTSSISTKLLTRELWPPITL